jgi:hypothetical protein
MKFNPVAEQVPRSKQVPKIEELLADCRQNPQKFIDWLETQPEYAHLLKCADTQQPLKLAKSSLKQLLKILQDLFWTDASALYGRAHVDEKLSKDANNMATVISVANGINVITTVPFILRCFSGMGFTSLVLSVVTSWGVLLFSNELGTAVVVRTAREKPGAKIAHLSFALINLLLSLTALPGTPLLLDRPGLAEYKAQELIEQEVQNQQNLLRDDLTRRNQQLAEQKQECEALQSKLDTLAKDDARRDGLYVRAFGTWAERDRDWSQVQTEQLPTCRQLERLRKEMDDLNKKLEGYLAYLRYQVAQNGPLLFLKKERHQIYLANFDATGLLRSGSEESRIAFEQIGSALIKGQLTSLGFAGFLFALSAVTSGAAVFMVACYAQRRDVALSFDAYLYEIREAMFHAIARGLLAPAAFPPALPPSGGADSNLRFFALCAEQIRQSGMCRYPALLEFIQDYTTFAGYHWQSKPHILLGYYHQRLRMLCQDVMETADALRQAIQMGDPAQVASLIQMVALAARTLEMELRGMQAFLARFRDVIPLAQGDLIALLQTVTFTRKYLMTQVTTRMLASQSESTHRYNRYLEDLQQATYEITQLCLRQISETAFTLGISP